MGDSVILQEVVLRETLVVDLAVEVVLPSEILDRLHLYRELCLPDHFARVASDRVSVITQCNLWKVNFGHQKRKCSCGIVQG